MSTHSAAPDTIRIAVAQLNPTVGDIAGNLAMARAATIGFGTYIISATTPFRREHLALLHRDPGHSWTVPELARLAATSRSVLGERFAQLLGISPMQYLAGWRMQIAADLLRTTRLKMHEIAERSGYGSEVAFSRAFSRHLGVAPGALRRAQD